MQLTCRDCRAAQTSMTLDLSLMGALRLYAPRMWGWDPTLLKSVARAPSAMPYIQKGRDHAFRFIELRHQLIADVHQDVLMITPFAQLESLGMLFAVYNAKISHVPAESRSVEGTVSSPLRQWWQPVVWLDPDCC